MSRPSSSSGSRGGGGGGDFGSGGAFEASFSFGGGAAYEVRVVLPPAGSVDAPLTLRLADPASRDEWRGVFPPREVEQMTSKTGVFQSFGAFGAMLASLVRAQANGLLHPASSSSSSSSDASTALTMPYAHTDRSFNTLAIDVLTYADLERLKQRRSGTSAPPSAGRETPRSVARRKLNKRYVLITVGSNRDEEDKIHYPLPLMCSSAAARESQAAAAAAAAAAPLETDVTALKAQIARLTHSMTSKPATTSSPSTSHSTSTKRSHAKQPLYHSASAIDVRSYRAQHRSRSHSTSPRTRSRSPSHTHSPSRSRSPRSPSHRSHSHHSHSRHRENGASSSSSSSTKRATRDRNREREREQREHEREPDLDSPTSRVARIPEEDGDALAGIAHLSRSTRHTSSRKKPHHIPGGSSSPRDPSEASVPDAPELTASAAREVAQLSRRLAEAESALALEQQVSATRLHALETENRTLRRKEADAVAKLTRAQEALALLTRESERLKAKVEEFVRAAATSSNATTQATSQGRARTRSRAASPALPHVRGASQSPSHARTGSASRAPSPYLAMQRERRMGGGSGRASPSQGSRAPSPSASGRNTPTTRSGAPSPARGPRPAGGIVPPLPVGSVRARSRSASPSLAPYAESPTRAARAPIDLTYRHWPSGRSSTGRSPLRRFDPSEYVAMKRADLASKAAEMAARHRAEIAQSTRQGPGLATSILPRGSTRRASSPSPARPAPSPNNAAANGFSNSWRGRRTPTATFEYLDSPGRSGGPFDKHSPSVYVSGSKDRARSLRYPIENEPSVAAGGSGTTPGTVSKASQLLRSSSTNDVDNYDDEYFHDDDATTTNNNTNTASRQRPQSALVPVSAERAGRGGPPARLPRQIQHALEFDADQDEWRNPSRRYDGGEEEEFAMTMPSRTKDSSLQPLVPVLTADELEAEDTPRDDIANDPGNVDHVAALTDRLAKLQQYLAAEKTS